MKMMEYAVMMKRKRLDEIDKLNSVEQSSDEIKCADVTKVTDAKTEVTKVMGATTEVTEGTKVVDVTKVLKTADISKVTDIMEVSKEDAEVIKDTEVSFVEGQVHFRRRGYFKYLDV